jgi:hypothetical protein
MNFPHPCFSQQLTDVLFCNSSPAITIIRSFIRSCAARFNSAILSFRTSILLTAGGQHSVHTRADKFLECFIKVARQIEGSMKGYLQRPGDLDR